MFPSRDRQSPDHAEHKEQKKRERQRLEKEKKEQKEKDKRENEMKKKFKVAFIHTEEVMIPIPPNSPAQAFQLFCYVFSFLRSISNRRGHRDIF